MAGRIASSTATLSAGSNQTIDTVNKLVANMLGEAGCPRCGRLALLEMKFKGDPPPDLVKEGVISITQSAG